MADFSTLKAYIASYVKQNGVGAITGEILQDVLLEMVEAIGDEALNGLASALSDEIANRENAVGGEAETRGNADTALQNAINAINTKLSEGYVYAGIATTATNPGTPTGKVFYFALAAGTYTNFVDSGAASIILTQGISILKYNGTAWSSEQLTAIDDAPTDGSSAVVKSGGVFTAIAGVLSKVEDGYLYRGIATTSTNPPAPQTNVFYLAKEAGTYTNFGGLVVTQGINILKYDGSAWSGEQIVGFDDVPTAESNNLVKSGGVYKSIGLQFNEWQYENQYASSSALSIGDTLLLSNASGFNTFKVFVAKGDKLSMIDIKYASASEKIFICDLSNVIIGEISKDSGYTYKDYDFIATQNCYVVGSSSGKGRIVSKTMETKFDNAATKDSDNFLNSNGVYKSIKNAEENIKIDADFSIAGYVHTDGDFRPGGDTYKSTDFINVSGYKSLKFSGYVSGSVLAGLSLYNEDRVMIGYIGNGTYTDEVVSISDKTMFVRMSGGVSYIDGFKLSLSASNAVLAQSNKKVLVNLDWQPNNFIRTTGVVDKYGTSAFSVSRKIFIKKGAEYFIDGLSSGSVILSVAFYSADGTMVGSVGGSNTSHTMEKLTIPSTAVYMMLTKSSADFYLYVEPYTLPSVIDTKHSSSLSDMVKAGGTIYLDDVSYVVDQTIEIPSNTSIIGNGKTRIFLGNTTRIFKIDNQSNIRISGIEFIGKNTISPSDPSVIDVSEIKTRQLEGTNDAIYITTSDADVFIEGCIFQDFNRAGIDIYRSHNIHSKHAKISNCNFYNCWYGILLDVRAEFNAVADCSFNLNKIGMYVAGGNNLVSNCHFDVNEVGFCVCSTLGENADHGSACNCTFNHNSVYGIACVDVNSGFIFTSANLYEGDVLLDGAQGVQIVNSVIAVAIYNQNQRTGINLITNNLFHTTYGGGTISSKVSLILKNNYYYDGSDSTDLNN